MNRKVLSGLVFVSAVSIVFAVLVSRPDILYGKGKKEPWFSEQLDQLRFLKRFQDARDLGTGKRAKKKFVAIAGADPPVGPNVILAVDTSLRMQFDENGHYYDLGVWPRADDPTVADDLGVSALATNYRRRYDGLIDDDSGGSFKVRVDRITVVDDQAADYADFFDPTRLSIAREGLAQVVDENDNVARFGLMRSRYGNGAVLPAVGNNNPARLMTPPQDDLAGEVSGESKKWKVSVAFTTTDNIAASADGTEVLIDADVLNSSATVYAALLLGPDEVGGLLPAGNAYDDSTDSPIGELLVDARAEAVRLMGADLDLYRECRNTAVVLVVGGAGGAVDPAITASSFAAVSAGGVTHRVPIFVVAINPPAADVATLQAIATNSGGAYFEVSNAVEVAYAANYAVQAVHVNSEDLDLGLPGIFQTTSPILGTVDLSNASDIDGLPLLNSAITTSGGAVITQRANVILTSGFSLPGFHADLRAFRAYRPELDATKPLGYRFVMDGTRLWVAHTPGVAERNIYTYVPGTGMLPFTTAAATVSTLRDYLGMGTDAEAAELIDFIRNQPLGAIIGSTPALIDAPSLVAPDEDRKSVV